MQFADLEIPASFREALSGHGFAEPTAVQAAVLEPRYRGRDLLVSSRTGSGKTVAFGLALAPTLLGERTHFDAAAMPVALVVAPTRELAQQVARELDWLYAPAGGRVVTCVGGTDPRAEAKLLARGPHLVVGTPGRLVDHLERRQLRLEGLHAVVLDEADEMLDLGFRDELERILRDAPPGRRTLMFSATVSREIEELARNYQKDAARIAATPAGETHADIEYRAHLIVQREREHAVVNVLRAAEDAQALVFCETRNAVNHLHANLVERGFAAVAISGELTQAERSRALQALRDRRARVLVATDVAARGLDLPDIGLVVHADLPHDAAVLQHRSGRTGRAGKKGVAVVLVPFARKGFAERMLLRAKAKAQWAPVPTPEAIRALDQDRLLRELTDAASEPGDDDLAVGKKLLEALGPEKVAAALVKLQRAQRPEPEELPETLSLLARPERKPLVARDRPQRLERPERAERPERRPFAPRERPAREESRGPARADARPKRTPSDADANAVWFTINVGRNKNADPKWLVPLLCRRGGVTKADIGRIQIGPLETRVAISRRAASRFAASARKPDPKDPRIHIEPAE